MAVSQNTLLFQDVDSSYDNSDDRDALALGPNKDNSDSEENRCSCFYSKPNYHLNNIVLMIIFWLVTR